MTTTADTLFGGRYRLVQRIARGGMGEVWRATDELLQRQVAIKLLREDLIGDPGFIGRFRAEARHTAVLSHPGIAQLYDYGEQGGRAYLVMELVPGDPLSWILARDGALEPERALRYIGQAALALQVAHDARVIHRDVKPANLIVTPAEQVKITDFGIAKAIGEGTLTGTGQVMGTAEYLSPEQAIGRDATPLSDIYALGIVLYECLAGRRPFANGNPVSIALAQVHEQPPPLPQSIAEPVQDLVRRLLSKDPVDRPAGGGALAREVAALLPDEEPLPAMVARRGVPQLTDSSQSQQPDATVPMPRQAATASPASPEDGSSLPAAAEPAATERLVPDHPDDPPPAPRTAKLQSLAARPTGRRRAPRRNLIDVSGVLGLLTSRNRGIIVIATAVALCAALVGFVLGQGRDRTNEAPPAGITVPAVRGESAAAAREALEAAGLRVLITYSATSSAEPDTVVEQDPLAGVVVGDGTVVSITVASERARALPPTSESTILALPPVAYRAETDRDAHAG